MNFSGIRLLKTALNVSNIAVAAVNDPSLGGDIDYLLYLMQSGQKFDAIRSETTIEKWRLRNDD